MLSDASVSADQKEEIRFLSQSHFSGILLQRLKSCKEAWRVSRPKYFDWSSRPFGSDSSSLTLYQHPLIFSHSSQRLKITHLFLIHKNGRFIDVMRLGLNHRIFKNSLRLNTISECDSQCQFVDNSVLERCSQPYDAGHCHSDISRHYFDMAKGACICASVYHFYFFKWIIWVNIHPLSTFSFYVFSGIWEVIKSWNCTVTLKREREIGMSWSAFHSWSLFAWWVKGDAFSREEGLCERDPSIHSSC